MWFFEIIFGDDNMDANICPKCKKENTVCVNEFLEYALEIMECKDCYCQYEVKYEMKIKEIKIKK